MTHFPPHSGKTRIYFTDLDCGLPAIVIHIYYTPSSLVILQCQCIHLCLIRVLFMLACYIFTTSGPKHNAVRTQIWGHYGFLSYQINEGHAKRKGKEAKLGMPTKVSWRSIRERSAAWGTAAAVQKKD